MTPNIKIKMVLYTEFLGFLMIILVLWANEVLDIPYEFFGSEPTPVNYVEAIIESVLVFLLGFYVMFISWFVFVGLDSGTNKQQICPLCKKIKTGDIWSVFPEDDKTLPIKDMEKNLCPECFDKIIKHV